MEASVLIVSRNRYAELHKTLGILKQYLDLEKHEVLVFLDGCTNGSEGLKDFFPAVKWEISNECLGASKARSILYKKAKGKILFGFDDDSHPLQSNFINITEKYFLENSQLGIIAFNEIRGIYESDTIPAELKTKKEDYFVKDFLGCGFAIRKDVYDKTRGFPVWIDIYGEEVCVAMETIEMGLDILFTHSVSVHHRTDKQKMNTGGANYFRFGKQLKNTASFYIVYYPFPLYFQRIARLFYLNFIKYAIKNKFFLKNYVISILQFIKNLKEIYSYRRPVNDFTIKKFNNLKSPKY